MINSEFWKGKKVFLTGHTGFKGSWTAMWLHSMGATVKGYALSPPTNPNLFNITRVSELIESEINDIRNYSALSQSILNFSPPLRLSDLLPQLTSNQHYPCPRRPLLRTPQLLPTTSRLHWRLELAMRPTLCVPCNSSRHQSGPRSRTFEAARRTWQRGVCPSRSHRGRSLLRRSYCWRFQIPRFTAVLSSS